MNFSNNINNNNNIINKNPNINKQNQKNNILAINKIVDVRGQMNNKKPNFNEIVNLKMEINRLVEENLNLKTQLIDIKSKLSQYDNILEKADLKYQEQINNYQKQIIKYNSYIHEIYIFFNNLTNNHIPKLNFSLKKNESILINFELFQKKLKIIEKYISELNKYLNGQTFNPSITDISDNNSSTLINNGYFLTELTATNNSLEERINNLEKQIINRSCYNSGTKKNTGYGKIKNTSINNCLRSKYHYGNNNMSVKHHQSFKPFKKIKKPNNFNKSNERYNSSFVKSFSNSKKKKLSSKHNENLWHKNSDLKFLKKSIPVNPKRSMTPLSKRKTVL